MSRPMSLAAALVGTLALSACGGTTKATPTTTTTVMPTPAVDVPDGVTLTEPGAELEFGEAGTVAYEANARRESVLEIDVTSVVKRPMSDFRAYQLDAATKASTPYYVRVKVTNVGTGDLGRTELPLWAVDGNDALVHSSSFSNDFKPCPSQTFPATFGPKATLSTCLVYLIPRHGELTKVSFRPEQTVAPVTWAGTIVDRSKPAKKKS